LAAAGSAADDLLDLTGLGEPVQLMLGEHQRAVDAYVEDLP